MTNQINDSGYRVEAIVEAFLQELMPVVKSGDFCSTALRAVRKGNYTRWNGKNGQMDFVIYLSDGRRVFVEVKGQKGGGSVEDKYLTSLHDLFSAARKPNDISVLVLHNQMDVVKGKLAICEETVNTLCAISKQMRTSYLDFQTMQHTSRFVYTTSLESFKEYVLNLIRKAA